MDEMKHYSVILGASTLHNLLHVKVHEAILTMDKGTYRMHTDNYVKPEMNNHTNAHCEQWCYKQ